MAFRISSYHVRISGLPDKKDGPINGEISSIIQCVGPIEWGASNQTSRTWVGEWQCARSHCRSKQFTKMNVLPRDWPEFLSSMYQGHFRCKQPLWDSVAMIDYWVVVHEWIVFKYDIYSKKRLDVIEGPEMRKSCFYWMLPITNNLRPRNWCKRGAIYRSRAHADNGERKDKMPISAWSRCSRLNPPPQLPIITTTRPPSQTTITIIAKFVVAA
jgi:hypothetical protein